MKVYLGAHVPHPAHTVSASGHKDVQRGMERQRIHPAQVTMVLPDDLLVHMKGSPRHPQTVQICCLDADAYVYA